MIKRIVTLSLMAIACLTLQAQTKNDVVTLAKSSGYWVAKPSVAIDKKNKKSVTRWNRTEKDDWYELSAPVEQNDPTAATPTDDLSAAVATSTTHTPYLPIPTT